MTTNGRRIAPTMMFWAAVVLFPVVMFKWGNAQKLPVLAALLFGFAMTSPSL